MARVNSAASTSTYWSFADPWTAQLALQTLPRTDTDQALGKTIQEDTEGLQIIRGTADCHPYHRV